jgi:GT2 family glycosyltransferase
MSEPARVSVIALFDRGEFEPCLSSLLAQEGVDFEVLAVVNDEETASRLPRHGRVRGLVMVERNPAYRRNAAASRAQGRYLAFIDDDAIAPPDWLARGAAFLEDDPLVAGTGGPNLGPPEAGFWERVTDLALSTPVIGAGSRAFRGGGELAEARPGEVHLVNFLVRRDWFERVNGFNEALGYGGEDTEFLYQAKLLGGKFMFDPGLVVFHHRRRFGPDYFRQRFRLRRQTAKLFLAYPRIYATSIPFLAALVLPPLLLLAFLLAPTAGKEYMLAGIALFYLFAPPLLARSLRKGLGTLCLLAPAVFLIHHSIYVLGLWWGLAEGLLPGGRRGHPPRQEDSRGL